MPANRYARHGESQWHNHHKQVANGHLHYDTAWRKPPPKPTFFQRLRRLIRGRK